MSIVRIKFVKDDTVKFISHLDMMKAFQRGIRRAGLNAEYSHGFNPQMQMVFGAPLSLGFTSGAEYADFTFSEDYDPKYVVIKLKEALPKGLTVLDAGIRTIKTNIMTDIKAAEYEMFVFSSITAEQIAEHILAAENLPVKKTRKGKTKIIDVRQLLLDSSGSGKTLRIKVKAGNQSNLNPRLLIQAINNQDKIKVAASEYNRISQFVEREEKLISPLDSQALETK